MVFATDKHSQDGAVHSFHQPQREARRVARGGEAAGQERSGDGAARATLRAWRVRVLSS